MAFENRELNQQNTSSTATTGGAQRRQRGQQAEAAGFINIYAPSSGGGRHKLGFLLLDKNVPWMAKLAARLEANPDDLGALKDVLEMEFNTPTAGDSEIVF